MLKPAVVEVKGLVKQFKDVRAIDELTLDVSHGIFGLIGPNGAGKTTLLRCLLGLAFYDEGTARVLGLDVRTEGDVIRRRVGVLHEKPWFPRYMTPFNYLSHVCAVYGNGFSPGEILSLVGLSNERNRKIGTLSAGMVQRLGIAQALVPSPELVFLDEPTSNLDVNGRAEIIQAVVDLHNDYGTSFLITSHILSELEKACHAVAFIKEGRLITEGSVFDIIQQYTSRRVKITCSDAQSLRDVVVNVSGVSDALVTGATSVTVALEGKENDVQTEIMAAASSVGVKVVSFDKADSLEEAYKEIMSGDRLKE